jgi:hypothetical protein
MAFHAGESQVGSILEELHQCHRRLRGRRRKDREHEIHYLETGRFRMDYARYRSQGGPIGSDAAEGTCKHLVKERYNLTGARWGRGKIPLVPALRLSIFNEEWEDDWREMRKAA